MPFKYTVANYSKFIFEKNKWYSNSSEFLPTLESQILLFIVAAVWFAIKGKYFKYKFVVWLSSQLISNSKKQMQMKTISIIILKKHLKHF